MTTATHIPAKPRPAWMRTSSHSGGRDGHFGRVARRRHSDDEVAYLYDVAAIHAEVELVTADVSKRRTREPLPPMIAGANWLLVCETHRESCRCRTEHVAQGLLLDPSAWCVGCGGPS